MGDLVPPVMRGGGEAVEEEEGWVVRGGRGRVVDVGVAGAGEEGEGFVWGKDGHFGDGDIDGRRKGGEKESNASVVCF